MPDRPGQQPFLPPPGARGEVVGDHLHPTCAGFVYLTPVIDCYLKKAGWSIGNPMPTELVTDALKNAAATTLIQPLAIWHSGRRIVYNLHGV